MNGTVVFASFLEIYNERIRGLINPELPSTSSERTSQPCDVPCDVVVMSVSSLRIGGGPGTSEHAEPRVAASLAMGYVRRRQGAVDACRTVNRSSSEV